MGRKSSKLKEFADDNFKLKENVKKFSKKKPLWEKVKSHVTSTFSFSHIVFKRLVWDRVNSFSNKPLFIRVCRTNCGKRRNFSEPFPKRQISDSFKLKEFAHNNFKFDENAEKFTKREENTAEKGESACF